MATPVSGIKPLPAARTAASDRRLRLDDILKLMVADGLLPAAEAEKLARARVHRFGHVAELRGQAPRADELYVRGAADGQVLRIAAADHVHVELRHDRVARHARMIRVPAGA